MEMVHNIKAVYKNNQLRYSPNGEGKLRIEITNNYKLDLSIGDLHSLLGFNTVILTTTTTGPNIVDITRGVDSWSVHCSLAGGSYDNDIASDILKRCHHQFDTNETHRPAEQANPPQR
jgi:hypothetical protein